MVGIGCPAHVPHNCIQHGTDILPIDVECIVLKICNYFSVYTVRTGALKEFCVLWILLTAHISVIQKHAGCPSFQLWSVFWKCIPTYNHISCQLINPQQLFQSSSIMNLVRQIYTSVIH